MKRMLMGLAVFGCALMSGAAYVKPESPSIRKSSLPYKLGFAGYTFNKLDADATLAGETVAFTTVLSMVTVFFWISILSGMGLF